MTDQPRRSNEHPRQDLRAPADAAVTAVSAGAPRQPASTHCPAAVVFDADGVLLDTEGHWQAARHALFVHHGRAFGPAENRQTVGTGISGTGRALSRLLGHPELADDLSDQLLALLSERIAEQPPIPLPGALALVCELHGYLPIGVASNSPRALLGTSLECVGLEAAFDVVIGADEVAMAKPEPDIYLAACRRLDAAPEQSVAIEDSPTGTAAARGAGLYVIGVSSTPGCELDADQTADSLNDAHLRASLGLPYEIRERPAGT